MNANSLKSWVLLAGLCLLACVHCLTCQPNYAGDYQLRLKDNGFGRGEVLTSPDPGILRFHVDGFSQPFNFDLQAVRSLQLTSMTSDQQLAAATDELHFELIDGQMITGRLRSLNAERAQVTSTLLGDIEIPRNWLAAINNPSFVGPLVYRGPLDDGTWEPIGAESEWNFQAGSLVAIRQGAKIHADVGMPVKCHIHLILSWRGLPDFQFLLGTDHSKKDGSPSVVTLEVWDKMVAMIRDIREEADVAMLSPATSADPRLELNLYVNQTLGTITACDQYGRRLESLDLIDSDQKTMSCVQLINSGPTLSLDLFEVREWDGKTIVQMQSEIAHDCVQTENETIHGRIENYADAEQSILLVTVDGRELTLPLNQLKRCDFLVQQTALEQNENSTPETATLPSEVNSAEQNSRSTLESIFSAAEPTTPDSTNDAAPQPDVVEVVLLDTSRLRGIWQPGQGEELALSVPWGHTITFRPGFVQALIGTPAGWSMRSSSAKQRQGNIDMGSQASLQGFANQESLPDSPTPLSWHPNASLTESPLSKSAVGAIIYRNHEEAVANTGRTKRPVARPSSNSTNQKPEIVFREGDIIEGTVEAADESGIRFTSPQTSTTTATTAQVDSLHLNPMRSSLELSDQEMQRLLTIPRSMKLDPPTHLFIATSGDYLRGRLVSIDQDKVVAEIKGEFAEIPRNMVSQIIWLYNRDWDNHSNAQPEINEDGDKSIEARQFRIHAITSGNRGLTFVPNSISQGRIVGQSQLLGDCTVELNQLDRLLFGDQLSQQIRELQNSPWNLTLAKLPKVYADVSTSNEGGITPGMESALVGKPAPDFGLDDLNGQRFVLGKQLGTVIVLDFWASWCGPCMQTMPQVDRAIQELNSNQIQLVAVNLQESPQRAAGALERLGINPTVLLDVDGEVGARYGATAIPQTVIINREGIVERVFVGGGSRFVEQFSQALQPLVSESVEPAQIKD
ncbi:MAG: TlpA family protein disulfide reductase [Planctomycetales bacterium]|nr:TlpA family protein disulfide reductase [Planctomycetales bacterium]